MFDFSELAAAWESSLPMFGESLAAWVVATARMPLWAQSVSCEYPPA